MKPTIYIRVLFLILGSFLGSVPIMAQEITFDIVEVSTNKESRTIEIRIKAEGRDGNILPINNAQDLSVFEIFNQDTTEYSKEEFERLRKDTLFNANEVSLHVKPKNRIQTGKTRTIIVKWKDLSDNEEFQPLGSIYVPEALDKFSLDTWLNLILAGFLFVTALLVFLSQIIPMSRDRQFRKKYVKPYALVKEEGRTRFDPISGQAFEDDELVVVKCRRMTSWDSWKYNDYQCPDYPDCMFSGEPCEHGEKNNAQDRFFSQQGDFRVLNWLWFGSLGGLTAFLCWVGLRNLISLFNQEIFEIEGLPVLEMLLGASLGLGLTFWLSYVEERGQSRMRISWGFITLRTFLGLTMGALVFGIYTYFIQSLNFDTPLLQFLATLPCYLIFSLFLGLILSFKSSILLTRSLLGGLLASVVAYTIYFWTFQLFRIAEWGQLLGFIFFGSIFAVLVATVVYRSSDFQLQIISPTKFQRNLHISKWLKSGIDIHIGTDPSCRIFVKWNDPLVEQYHVLLKYTNAGVRLESQAETLVNGRNILLYESVILRHGDIIQLGRGGSTRLRFLEKEQANVPGNRQINSPTNRKNSGIKINRRIS